MFKGPTFREKPRLGLTPNLTNEATDASERSYLGPGTPQGTCKFPPVLQRHRYRSLLLDVRITDADDVDGLCDRHRVRERLSLHALRIVRSRRTRNRAVAL